jgi:hypothetical protein
MTNCFLATSGYVTDILPAYNVLHEHIETQLRHFTAEAMIDVEGLYDAPGQQTMLQTNTMNAQSKLKKYRGLLSSPVYPAALVLVPWNKWTYLESACDDDELQKHKNAIQDLWDRDYATLEIGDPVVQVNVVNPVVQLPVRPP